MKKFKLACLVIVGLVILWSIPTLADFYVIGAGSSGGDTSTVFFDGQANTNTDKRYAGIAGSTHGSSNIGKVFPMTRAGTIKNFTVNIQENTLVSKTVTITLEKNNSDTAITATYNSSTSLGVVTISGEVSYNAHDTFSIYAQASDSTSNNLKFSGTFDIEY